MLCTGMHACMTLCLIYFVVLVNKQEKPQGHYPAVPPSPRGAKDIMVTQDTRSSLCSKRRDEYVWPSKNRRSGASDHQKNGKKKRVLLDPVLTAG